LEKVTSERKFAQLKKRTIMNQKNEKMKDLRKKALQKLGKKINSIADVERMQVDEIQNYIEELRVHQIELEMQNQELLSTQEKLEESNRKYSHLYDFAPVGYLTMDFDGKIIEANLTATKMINAPRKVLIGSLIYQYLVKEDQDIFYLHMKNLSGGHSRHTCEVHLAGQDPEVCLRLDSIRDSGNSEKGFFRTTMTDITVQKKMETALSHSENQLKLLSSKLMEVHEKERKRIAYDLHDGVAQMLAAVNFYIKHLSGHFSENSDEFKILVKCMDINQKAMMDLQKIVSDLRPTVLELGLIAGIDWLINQYQAFNPPIRIIKKIKVEDSQIPENLKPVIFRILQEILSNIAKHSEAKQAEIFLNKSGDTLELVVKDNGKGFEITDGNLKRSTPGIGISSIRERARSTGGLLEILSSRKTGTTVSIRWPQTGVKE
jgi:two-component system, NarL family, sensor histidine kinase UhpB